jgi:hypothetical protein
MTRVSRVCSPALFQENLLDVLQLVLSKEGLESFAFVVHDGVRQKVDSSMCVLSFLNASFTHAQKCIHITSLRFYISLGDGTYKRDQHMAIRSWELSDYIEAFKSSRFKTSAEWLALL